MAAKVPGSTLPVKDQPLFREMVRLYEQKQYKKSIKTADAILKKNPTHGETYAMKGLVVNTMAGPTRRPEAIELAKLGLRHDLKSYVCWHVFGLIHRSDANYPEAVKCYRNALRIDPDNQQVLRDLAVLQVHLRDVQPYIETRRAMLGSKTFSPTHWLGFASAHQFAGNPDMAVAILDRYDSTLDSKRLQINPEDGEVVMYHSELVRESSSDADALKFLSTPNAKHAILDEVGLAEAKAVLMLRTGAYAEASTAYLALLAGNPDNHEFHAAFQKCILATMTGSATALSGLTGTQIDTLLAAYTLLQKKHPRCRTIPWILLKCLPVSHPAYIPTAAAYIRAGVRKGLPALYTELKKACVKNGNNNSSNSAGTGIVSWVAESEALAEADRKRAIYLTLAQEAFDACVASSKAVVGTAEETMKILSSYTVGVKQGEVSASSPSSWFPSHAGSAAETNTSSVVTVATASLGSCSSDDVAATFFKAAGDTGTKEAPSTFPFAGLLLCKCLDAAGKPAEGIVIADRTLEHSPTVLELYLAKGQCLKHQGALAEAAAVVDHCRSLDLADRHLNAKAVKYFLRAGKVDEAENLMALFARHDSKKPHADPLASVRDVQVMWFELECGIALEKKKDYGRALKQYVRLVGFFDAFREDAFDYHAYCLRRGTLRAYSAMMEHGDFMKVHSYFIRAASGAARVYAALHRDTVLLEELKKQAKEASEKATAAAAAATPGGAAAKPVASEDGEDAGIHDPGVDTDPFGFKLMELTAPATLLGEAWKYASFATENLPPVWRTSLRRFETSECKIAPAVHPLANTVGAGGGSGTTVAGLLRLGSAVTQPLAAEAHVVCADVAIERGALGVAATHLVRAASLGGAARAAEMVGSAATAAAVGKAASTAGVVAKSLYDEAVKSISK